MYNVKFLDNAVKQYAANTIAMNILFHVDSYGHNLKTLDGTVYYKRDESAVS